MNQQSKRPGDHRFIAFELSLEIIRAVRGLVVIIRRQDTKLAQQLVASASSLAANIAEGSRRSGGDRLHLFRIAAGSADETRAHLRVAHAWGWLRDQDIEPLLKLLDRQLALLWGLTH